MVQAVGLGGGRGSAGAGQDARLEEKTITVKTKPEQVGPWLNAP